MTCPCRPWREIIAAVEGDVVAMGLPAEMGESSVMQLVGNGCAVECAEHPGQYRVLEKMTLFQRADDLARSYRANAVKCPLCYEGRELDRCGWCDFGGNPDGSICGHCEDGHVPGGPCGLCDGSGHVTYQQLILEEARRSVTGWLNDAFSPAKSMARWADMRRQLRPVIAGAQGLPAIIESNGVPISGIPPILQLVDANGCIQAELRGISWGYSGSGPRALAIILSDALPERFESYDAALVFAESVPQEDAWSITAP